jgi:hypothetical protein
MNNRNDIQDELNGLNSNLGDKAQPFSVPEGYFEEFASSVMAKIRNQQPERILSSAEEIQDISPLLAGISRKMPYSVPNDFFEGSLSGLSILVKEDQESPILAKAGKAMPYEVPVGYFAGFAGRVLNVVAPKSTVIPIMRRKWMRLAVAAMVAGVISISGYLYLGHKGHSAQDRVAAELKGLPTQALDSFITNVDISTASRDMAHSHPVTHAEVKKLLQDVPESEMNAFLSEVPGDDASIN